MNHQYLTFFVRTEEYAVEILRVQEILELETISRVPGMPRHIRGVINRRGSILPVIDLSAKFGYDESEPTRRTCIVVIEIRSANGLLVAGVIADAVSEVIDLADEQVEPPPPFGTRVRADFLRGMGKAGSRLLLVLDVDRLLSPVELLETQAELREGEELAVSA
jgi:purine-binding chemotaxis protein CheW